MAIQEEEGEGERGRRKYKKLKEERGCKKSVGRGRTCGNMRKEKKKEESRYLGSGKRKGARGARKEGEDEKGEGGDDEEEERGGG